MSVRFVRTGQGVVTDHNQLNNRGVRTHAEIDSYMDELDAVRGNYPDINSRITAIENLNASQEQRLNSVKKVITFVIPGSPLGGAQKVDIRYPFDGTITEVYASCGTQGISPSTITVQKCTHFHFTSNPVWTDVATIDFTAYSNSCSDIQILDSTVTANDHFRLFMTALGAGFGDITVEITVESSI